MSNVSVKLTWDKQSLGKIENKTMKSLFNLGFDIAAQARRNAPYQTSALRNTIRAQEAGNNAVDVIAGGSYGGKKVNYAAAVEYGHKQTPGRFVPGEWRGNRFIYNPNSKTGMVLKKSFVNGSHYMENAQKLIMSGNYMQKYFGDITK